MNEIKNLIQGSKYPVILTTANTRMYPLKISIEGDNI